MNTFNHQRPVRNDGGEVTGHKPAPVSRVTVAELGGQFGLHKRHRLVVTLTGGDVIEFRPERTRQKVTILAVDVYRFVLRCAAQRSTLEKARERKVKLAESRDRRRIANADRKLRSELRKERNAT